MMPPNATSRMDNFNFAETGWRNMALISGINSICPVRFKTATGLLFMLQKKCRPQTRPAPWIHQTLHYYGFLRRKKPALLEGSIGLVMNVEETPLMLYTPLVGP